MTYYFYDLETSGINPRAQRIMQFAGQRTDENFQPIGEPQNWLVRLTDEVLPDPEAVLVTGITPQQTLSDGYSEAEFLELFMNEVSQPDTVVTGFNSIRFDDEFMRSTLWRNFYDPYEWQWQDGCSRWDLLDVVRMIRALRPEGIEWPFDDRPVGASEHGRIVNGSTKQQTEIVPSNRLELLTKINNLDHANAHDALSDVRATIAVARMLKEKQPQIFNYLFEMRSKKKVKELVSLDESRPFVYTSGRYEAQHHKTTVAYPLATGRNENVVVYDLRYDPSEFINLSEQELGNRIFARYEERQKSDFVRIPVKELQYNRVPAVAPLGVLTQNDGWARLDLKEDAIEKYLTILRANPEFAKRLEQIYQKARDFKPVDDPDYQLYDGFLSESDKQLVRVVRSADMKELKDFTPEFKDARLKELLVRYKARNYSSTLSAEERGSWETYRSSRIFDGVDGQLSLSQYSAKLAALAATKKDENDQFLLQELQLYAESIVPFAD